MTMRPDPTFHASPKLAMEAPPESFAYTLFLSPDFSKPDALAVIDVKPGSPTSRLPEAACQAYCPPRATALAGVQFATQCPDVHTIRL
jgi:hypothetical protein